MGKPKVFITREIPEHLLKPYRQEMEISLWNEALVPVPRERLLQEVEKSDGLLTMLSDAVDRPLVTHAKHLKIVSNLAVGFDNIDVAACTEKGIAVTNTPDVLTDTTADLAMALVLTTARRVVEAAEFIKKGEWKEWGPFLLAGTDVHHKTIGIVGMGRIGTAVAKRAKGFEMNILYHNRSRNVQAETELGAKYVSFETLLQEADFVIDLLPLTEETRQIFNEKAFRMMKNEAIFVNVGRGKSVDEKALYQAVKTGEIAGCGLDVFAEEPIGKDHPLLALPQVVCLPHIGSATTETRSAMVKLALENLHAVLVRGQKPLTPVNELGH